MEHLKKKIIIGLSISVLLLTAILFAFVTDNNKFENKKVVEIKKRVLNKNIKARKPIEKLTLEELWVFYQINPCYLPLIKDSSLWENGKPTGFDYKDLINDLLPDENKYRNRYLVGDFNVIERNGQNKGVEEIYPNLNMLKDFEHLPEDLVIKMDTTAHGTQAYKFLVEEIKTRLKDSADIYLNFLEKVWKYKMLPIKRQYSINDNNLYAAGQTIILCEACKDTLIMQGKFAVSAKRQDFGLYTDKDGNSHKYFIEYLPTGKRRRYYAGKNRITIKNWETERKYEKQDIKRDEEVGGGSAHVTYYEGKVQLPNFMLIDPFPIYENAMHHNGIHEVALRGLARGMLGTGNSIGCIRVTDFGSKFIRWWTPQNCNFFISYDDKRYHKKIDYKGSIMDYLPFKTAAEGQKFRKWINQYRPDDAKRLEISDSGDFRNGFILDAYYALEKDYKKYLSGK